MSYDRNWIVNIHRFRVIMCNMSCIFCYSLSVRCRPVVRLYRGGSGGWGGVGGGWVVVMLLLYLYVLVHLSVCLWCSKYFALIICVTFSFRVTLRREQTSTTVDAGAAMDDDDDVRQQSVQCDHVTSAMTSEYQV